MLFLDIETQNRWEPGEPLKVEELQISYAGVIDGETDKEYDFWEADIEKLGDLLKTADKIVHYNGFSFDMPVIANYLGDEILNLPQIDLMVAAHKKIGFRPKLDDLATATLGHGKIGKGSDAIVYWENEQYDELRDYCMMDVRVTMELYNYGLNNRKIKYFDRNGFIREVEIDWSLGERVPVVGKSEDLIEMF